MLGGSTLYSQLENRTLVGLSQSAHPNGLATVTSASLKTQFRSVRHKEVFAGILGKILPGSKRKDILFLSWAFVQRKKDPEDAGNHSGTMMASSFSTKQDTTVEQKKNGKKF